MVQRKVTNKLGINADNLRHEKHLSNPKPSSQHHQDGKNRGPDLKKKMKKSRSIKLSDIESLKSSSLRKNLSEPGKPPPLKVPNTATTTTTTTTPQKQPLLKTTIDGSPNYMKSTSCFDARKEQSQVSFRNSQSVSDGKIPRRRSMSNSNGSSSGSNNKPAKTLTKSSSLKMVRTLTKSPSFKPARPSAKKSSRVVLCADMDAQSATCSSTLKDSKFPPYLTLNPGGTEAEGTSVMKVCPYTYCSLNGHHHAPLPPLKCFLSARRRSMKTQKIMKLQALSPRKGKPSNGGKEIDSMKVIFDEKPENSPLVEEVGMDFFVEIYAKSKEDVNGETGGKVVYDEEKKIDFGGEAAVVKDYHEEQAFENLSDGSPKSEIDADESLERYSDRVQTDGGIIKGEEEEVSFEFERFENAETGDSSGSEATDMEWEEEQFSEAEVEDETNNPSKMDDESESKVGYSLEVEISDLQEECVIMPEDAVSNYNEVIPVYKVMEEEACDEEGSCVDEDFGDGCAEQDLRQVSDSSIYDQLFGTEDASEEESSAEERDTKTDLVHTLIASTPVEEPKQEEEAEEKNRVPEAENVILKMYSQLGDNKTEVAAEATEDVSNVDDKDNLPMNDSGDSDQYIDADTQGDLSEEKYSNIDAAQNQSLEEKDQGQAKKSSATRSDDSKEQTDIMLKPIDSTSSSAVGTIEVEDGRELDNKETILASNNSMDSDKKRAYLYAKRNTEQELPNASSNLKWTIRRKKLCQESEEEREFNPREPNFLPLVPDPEAEKVDLKHQTMDERKNSEEWMIDHALQQTVTKLAPARKRKVALLVEAFEAVMPIPKYESHIRQPSAAFSHARPIHACS
ncbi:hypothetical protein FEM48_Zijuj05G0031700 [Ziziphus jujuba var. spinosa]|uniref:Calmodulin-binding domain-containing protein n=1 Tax=Ziziphus jujuba var. spinosa TaxID=714518 RepID=A0A978VCH2_ZIZJJ|nr:calmodulin binding protein PICBP-like [Ziziphus jujuba var. spinosa]KAH7528058.1 hypothetical protein FEM48_Zijuj05G0031400 [Ziziphus jujuba var. spinosa]KAH7528061.1 hypothetical protein FEM48_Zijuj05G0031700 [Ziziphus jujuba var. spinosa]